MASAGAARADTVILAGPGNITGDQNIVFNTTGLTLSGLTVQGATNQSATIYDFSGAGENLGASALGQAQVVAADGGLTALEISPHKAGTTFTSLMFNLDAKANGSVIITVDRKGHSAVSGTFDISKNGQNFFRIIASNGDLMTDVHLTTTSQLADVAQVRVTPAAVPVPASAIGGAGIFGLIGLRKLLRRRSI